MPTSASFTIEHVDWNDSRAIALRAMMDAEMQERYGLDDPADADLSAAIGRALAVDVSTVVDTVLLLDGETAVAHASIRMLQLPTGPEWEVKRVIVDDSRRGRGVGRALMAEIIEVARRGGARRLILQSGDRQPEAVALYTKLGFTPIPVYPPYSELMPQSLCFELLLD
jgi:GNAT superfamily N-acetyltransferase